MGKREILLQIQNLDRLFFEAKKIGESQSYLTKLHETKKMLEKKLKEFEE